MNGNLGNAETVDEEFIGIEIGARHKRLICYSHFSDSIQSKRAVLTFFITPCDQIPPVAVFPEEVWFDQIINGFFRLKFLMGDPQPSFFPNAGKEGGEIL